MTVKMTKEEVINKRVDEIAVDSPLWNYYKKTPLNELSSRDEKLIKKEIQARAKTAGADTVNLDTAAGVEPASPDAFGGGMGMDSMPEEGAACNSECEVVQALYVPLDTPFKSVSNAVIKAYNDINDKNSATGDAPVNNVEAAAATLAGSALLVLGINTAWKHMKSNKAAKDAFAGVPAAAITTPQAKVDDSVLTESVDTIYLIEAARAISLLEDAVKTVKSRKIAKIDPKVEIPALKEKGAKLVVSVIVQANDKVSGLLGDKEFVTFMSKNKPEVLKIVEDFANSIGETKKMAKTPKDKIDDDVMPA